MYTRMSRSGSIDSSVISCAITSLADASSICTPRKMIRSSKSLLYGFISLIPYDVRSTNDGSTYLDSAGRHSPAALPLPAFTVSSSVPGRVFTTRPLSMGLVLDRLGGLAGVDGEVLGQGALQVENLLRLVPDVGGGAADPA